MWARAAARLLDYATAQGAPRERLLADAGLAAVDLADLDARVPLLAVYTLIEAAVEHTDDPHFGLHFASELEIADFDAVGFLMATSSTLGEAFERAARYWRIWSDGERYEIDVAGDSVRMRITPYGPSRPAHRHSVEMAFYDVVVNGGRLVATALPLRHVRFRHPAPPGAELHDRLFGVAVEFGAPMDELVLAREVLDIPLPGADAAMCQFFERYTRDKLADVPDRFGLRERARKWLADHLHEPDATLENLADRLGMSARTLQRRLRDQGCSVQSLADEVRRERALGFLDTSMAIAEIAYLLGYSDASAFHRAFKRWTGSTPDAFRSRPPCAGEER